CLRKPEPMGGFSEMRKERAGHDRVGSPSRKHPRPTFLRELLACCGVGSVLLSGVGCHSVHRSPKAHPEPAAPAGPPDPAPHTVSVDLTKPLDEVQFHKDVTPDQRVKTHLDLGRVFETQGNHEGALLEYQEALAACEQKGLGKTRSKDQALAHRRIAGS